MNMPGTITMILASALLASIAGCGREPPAGTIPADRHAMPGRGRAPRTGVSEVDPLGDKAVVGQTIYVPAYSHIFTGNDARTFNLAVTLSVRNTDRDRPIVLSSVRYHDHDGRLVRDYLKQPLLLAPLASMDFFVKESDTSGGSSANFLVEWSAEHAVSAAIAEAAMIGTASTQGLSFICSGRVVAERHR